MLRKICCTALTEMACLSFTLNSVTRSQKFTDRQWMDDYVCVGVCVCVCVCVCACVCVVFDSIDQHPISRLMPR